jgi:type III secretion protein C
LTSLRKALTEMGVIEPRFGWGELPEQGVVLVSGPPQYVATIEQTLALLPRSPGGQQVAVYRLRHASVDDRRILYRDREITTPGLATVLRNLISGQGGAPSETLAAIAAPLRGITGDSSPACRAGHQRPPRRARSTCSRRARRRCRPTRA